MPVNRTRPEHRLKASPERPFASMPSSTRERFTLIAGLYVSQSIPLGFFIIALPAILRQQGVGLETIGLLGALALPWLLKFLWAPLLDRFGSSRWGHYRSWILPLQGLSVLTVVAVAWIDPGAGLAALLVAGAFFMLLSATQDIATDGLAVRVLQRHERGAGNGIQVSGYYLGQIMGGAGVLVLFSRYGWSVAMLAMATALALPLLPALRFSEPMTTSSTAKTSVGFRCLYRFAGRPGAGTWILILLLYRTGDAMALTMVNPMLVDQGFSLEQVGLLLGLVSSVAAVLGALGGGLLVERLGRKPSLVLFGLLHVASLSLYQIPASGRVALGTLYIIVAIVAFLAAMTTASLYTNMMDRCKRATAASDFTLQQSICAVGPMLGAIFSGFSAAAWGYSTHFVLAAVIALAGVGVTARWLTSRHAAPELAESV